VLRTGGALLAGGAIWLGGVALLESGVDVDSFAVRGCFSAAGLLVGLGLWNLRARLPSTAAKVGSTFTAVTAALVAIGFALGSFGGFLLVYAGLLFLIPLGMVILAVGLWRGGGLPRWATWIPALLAAAGLITYGFHALVRDIWDPPDAILFIIIGAGWVFLGIAAIANHPQGAAGVADVNLAPPTGR
jgi:hypothetical protein